jgi:hypothetical protein
MSLNMNIIEYPDFINECAVYIGKLRNLYNYELNEEQERFKRGDLTEMADIIGVKGELIFSYYLHSLKIQHTLNKLLSNKPVYSWDIKIGDTTYDVKTIKNNAPHFLVNEEAHLKNKGIDIYVFIQLLNNNKASIWKCNYDKVNEWPIANFKYTNAYYKKIDV